MFNLKFGTYYIILLVWIVAIPIEYVLLFLLSPRKANLDNGNYF